MEPLKVFISYSHQDDAYCIELKKWLVQLTRQKRIETWTDHKLVAGAVWDLEIKAALEKADLIILLLSQDFIASEYIYTVEYSRARERHHAGEAYIVPIVVRPCDWKPLIQWQVLPPGGTPVSKNPSPDDAWSDVLDGLKNVIKKLRPEVQSPDPKAASNAVSPAFRSVPASAAKLVDRTRHEAYFDDFYHDMLHQRPGSVQIYIIVEDDLDRPEFLVDRIFELQVATLSSEANGKRRGSCLRKTGGECFYGSVSSARRCIERNLFLAFSSEAPNSASAKQLFENEALSLHSHILFEQTVRGEEIGTGVDELVHWFVNNLFSEARSTRAQWLAFLTVRFSSLDDRYAALRSEAYNQLKQAFGRDGRLNANSESEAPPALLFPPPDAVNAEHLSNALAQFPIESVADRNKLATDLFSQLVLTEKRPRIDHAYRTLEQVRKNFQQTGIFIT